MTETKPDLVDHLIRKYPVVVLAVLILGGLLAYYLWDKSWKKEAAIQMDEKRNTVGYTKGVLTPDNYLKLQVGMRLEEAIVLMGEPTSSGQDTEYVGATYHIWFNDGISRRVVLICRKNPYGTDLIIDKKSMGFDR